MYESKTIQVSSQKGGISPRLLVFLRIFNSKNMNSTMITWNTQQFRVMVKVDTENNRWQMKLTVTGLTIFVKLKYHKFNRIKKGK